MKRHKLAAFHVRFIEIPVLECGVVSQQCNGMQYTSSNIGIQIHMPWRYTGQDSRQLKYSNKKEKTLKDNNSSL